MNNQTELSDFLKKEAASMRRGGNILLAVGIVVVVLIVGYFGFILHYLSTKWNYDTVIGYVISRMDSALDAAPPKVEEWVLTQLPGLMDKATDTLIEKAPEIRAKAEEYADSALDEVSDRIRAQIGEKVRDLLVAHGDTIREALEAAGDIQKSEDAKEHLKVVLEEEFEKVAVADVDPYKDDVLQALKDIDNQLGVLVQTDPDKLTEEQQLERELVQIVYTLCHRLYATTR